MAGYPELDNIQYPEDLRRIPESKLPDVCKDVREYLIDTLAEVGGHFASNLGVIELTVALHYVLNTPDDKLIWDVGHQIYPHKILTGRKHTLPTVRKFRGMSGFPKREESIYDLYNTGHAGTSISQVIGEAVARDVLKQSHKCVAVIGDASISSGMAFEALNHGGHIKNDCLVVLNDNDMSISNNVGALNLYLKRILTSTCFNGWRKFWYTLVVLLPVIGPVLHMMSRRVEKSFRDFFTPPGSLFTDFGFHYIGPVDGHNIKELVRTMRKALSVKGPVLLHVLTQKGKGYTPAEQNPITYHSVSVFNRKDGSFIAKKANDKISYSEIVGTTLIELVEKNERVVAVTPAMIEGSGLRALYDRYPEKVYDVGIAEQHSLTFAGALASAGLVPYMCIYSTFLNRALDQLNQDIALMKLPVRLVIDRAGCVGPDGETHQGLYDAGIILSVPEVHLYAPATGAELKSILLRMEDYSDPIAVRFPKGSCLIQEMQMEADSEDLKPVVHGKGKDLAIIAIGVMWHSALEVEKEIRTQSGILSRVVGIRWVRPMDEQALIHELEEVENFVLLEDSYIYSSAASYILANLPGHIKGKHLHTFAFPEELIEHGSREEIMHQFGLSVEAMTGTIQNKLRPGGKVYAFSARTSEN